MNRHGYKVRKFGREKDQRRALIKGLADQLILNESIETTLPKAKATMKYTEKLITKAKKAKDDLHVRRQVINSLATLGAARKLVDELSPKLGNRSSGYLRVKRTSARRGDGTQLARISFVDNLEAAKTPSKVKSPAKKAGAKQESEKPAAKQTVLKPDKGSKSQPKQAGPAARRTGRRGNR